jgi:hypothetical protein
MVGFTRQGVGGWQGGFLHHRLDVAPVVTPLLAPKGGVSVTPAHLSSTVRVGTDDPAQPPRGCRREQPAGKGPGLPRAPVGGRVRLLTGQWAGGSAFHSDVARTAPPSSSPDGLSHGWGATGTPWNGSSWRRRSAVSGRAAACSRAGRRRVSFRRRTGLRVLAMRRNHDWYRLVPFPVLVGILTWPLADEAFTCV